MSGMNHEESTESAGEPQAPPRGRLLGRFHRRRGHARRRVLRATAALPALFTLGNGLAGFGAVHYASRAAVGETAAADLQIAGWLIFLAMVCDMLDGRVARMTRRTSDFGGQLDSLCDVISFGVAPAMLMLRAVALAVGGMAVRHAGAERLVWPAAGVYVACAALRLARFNVENEPDESAHMNFVGLPSPGAAAAVVGLVLLFARLHADQVGDWLSPVAGITMPVITLIVALLMVSRFRYPHVINQYVRGRRPFSYLVKIVVVLLVAFLKPLETLAAVTVFYALSGPIGWGWLLVRDRLKRTQT
ncbi:MAG TPA: CDP-diacylglycerol--serine O-phosphatidyltransferase [Phycisphaerales bacterium]|nr:CDP-diacylglycerol--serine O-phosphatidyltransferase [Phycisphaerales bacterium]